MRATSKGGSMRSGVRRRAVPAGHAVAVAVSRGEEVAVVNTHGTQVVDTWAFAAGGDEHLSMEHTREVLQRTWFAVGDRLVGTRYTPLLEIVADSSPGRHDTLIAPCSAVMFERMGAGADHRSCASNLHEALASAGRRTASVPAAWNLFMSVPIAADGALTFERPRSAPGDAVVVRALADLLLVCSSCPDDLYPTNGGDGRPRDVELRIGGADARA